MSGHHHDFLKPQEVTLHQSLQQKMQKFRGRVLPGRNVPLQESQGNGEGCTYPGGLGSFFMGSPS